MSNSNQGVKRYNLVLPLTIWEKVNWIARKEQTSVVAVIRASLRLFFEVYAAIQEGKTIKIDGQEVQIHFLSLQ